jgi:hypothetical protein
VDGRRERDSWVVRRLASRALARAAAPSVRPPRLGQVPNLASHHSAYPDRRRARTHTSQLEFGPNHHELAHLAITVSRPTGCTSSSCPPPSRTPSSSSPVLTQPAIFSPRSILGWTYTAAWSVSFYGQFLLNWLVPRPDLIKLHTLTLGPYRPSHRRRKSVSGLSIDFTYLNPLGFACITVRDRCDSL